MVHFFQPSTIRLAMVDDHQMVIDGLLSMLEDQQHMTISFTTNTPGQVLELLQEHPVDILLTDIMMPGLNGQELAKRVRKQHADLKILALSMSGEGSMVQEMIEDADIAGYVLKNIGKQELIEAIETIAQGGTYFSEEVRKELERNQHIVQENQEANLTLREIEIIRLIERENNNKQIAEQLFISERTVETHRKNILRKTQTNSVLGLIKYAYEHKLIEKPH
jgi:two-component system nitrate/nitrite response regulator NarL